MPLDVVGRTRRANERAWRRITSGRLLLLLLLHYRVTRRVWPLDKRPGIWVPLWRYGGAVLGARVAVFVGGAGLDLGRGRGYEFCCGPSGWGDGCDAGELAAHGALAFWFQACEDAVGGVSSVGVISAVIPSRFSWRGTRRSGLLSSARRMLGRGFDQARGSIRWSLGG
jgi:hypothetical protein